MNILIPSVFLGEQDQIKLYEFKKCIQNGAVVVACNRASHEELQKKLLSVLPEKK